MKLLVDTNVLLRIAQPQHPQRPAALGAATALIESDSELCVVPQVLYEFYVVATRPVTGNGLAMSDGAAERSLDEIVDNYRLLRDERGIYAHWRTVLASRTVLGKVAHDARLVAAMMRHGLTHILTFNVIDFGRFSGIKVVSPEDVIAGRVNLS